MILRFETYGNEDYMADVEGLTLREQPSLCADAVRNYWPDVPNVFDLQLSKTKRSPESIPVRFAFSGVVFLDVETDHYDPTDYRYEYLLATVRAYLTRAGVNGNQTYWLTMWRVTE